MLNHPRTVIGIDPASGKKGSYVFCPEKGLDEAMQVPKLRELLKQWSTEQVLVCWDAPLTGPSNPDDRGKPDSLTQRDVETKLAAIVKGIPGVTVRGYSGLTHWTVTRHLLGLPRVGPYDLPEQVLPLKLAFEVGDLEPGRGAVVEVHPTPAAWCWMMESKAEWLAYKGLIGTKSEETWAEEKRKRVASMWKLLVARHAPEFPGGLPMPCRSDDAFDAPIAWLLGRAWLRGDGVHMWGDRRRGGMLMPSSIGAWQG